MKSVLFADNDADFLDTRAEFLEMAGYNVVKALSPADVERCLQDIWSPLVIFDMRLVDDDDENDLSGLHLAKLDAGRAVAKIVLSGHLTHEIVRELLRQQRKGRLSLNVLAKQEGAEILVEAVNSAFAHDLHINWDLVIRWNDSHPLSFPHIASLIEPDIKGARLSDRAGELEDLFRRLFYEKSQITIDRLLWQRQGRVVVTVFSFAPDKPSESFVVVCGSSVQIMGEFDRVKNFAPLATDASIPSEATASVLGESAETTHFAAYILVGLPIETFQTFAELYHSNPKRESFQIAIDSLTSTFATWHRNQRVPPEREISERQLCREKVGLGESSSQLLETQVVTLCKELAAQGLDVVFDKEKISFQMGGDQLIHYQNPLLYLFDQMPKEEGTQCVNAPGILTSYNMLIAPDHRVWLTDFSDAGPAPMLWCFAALEAVIRFDLVESDDIRQIYQMELRLTNSSRIEQIDSQDADAPIRKALQIIQLIRRAAFATMDWKSSSYMQAMLFHSAGRIAAFRSGRYTRKELLPVFHALLALAMIYDRGLKAIGEGNLNTRDSASSGLQIEVANRVVSVEGKKVDLTPIEFKLVTYLYERNAQLCLRKDIFEHVWEEEKYDPSTNGGRLDTNMDRLRKKIELDPDSPRYLMVERSVGYRLVTNPNK